MNITKTLLGAAALYALGRFTHDLKADDMRRYASALNGLESDDVRRFAWDTADDLLLKAGLRRQSTVPSTAAVVMGGIGAGLLIGAGLTFFLMSDAGKGLRESIREEARAATNGGSEQASSQAS
jgi:hypothetical protein